MYHGSRPSDENLKNIAEVLADNIEGSTASSIALELRALYWISDMGSLMAERIGAEAVVEAMRRLYLYAAASFRIIQDQFPSEERAKSLTVLADLGVGARLAESLLATLIEHEADDEWRKDLQSTTGMDWIRRVLSANLRATLAGLDQLNEKTGERQMEDWISATPMHICITGAIWNSGSRENSKKRLPSWRRRFWSTLCIRAINLNWGQ